MVLNAAVRSNNASTERRPCAISVLRWAQTTNLNLICNYLFKCSRAESEGRYWAITAKNVCVKNSFSFFLITVTKFGNIMRRGYDRPVSDP